MNAAFATHVIELSQEYGVNAAEHLHNGGFHFDTWWEDIVSNMPDDDITKLLTFRGEKAGIISILHSKLESECCERTFK